MKVARRLFLVDAYFVAEIAGHEGAPWLFAAGAVTLVLVAPEDNGTGAQQEEL